jgi:hypothetical protein
MSGERVRIFGVEACLTVQLRAIQYWVKESERLMLVAMETGDALDVGAYDYALNKIVELAEGLKSTAVDYSRFTNA